MSPSLSADDQRQLRRARQILENPGFAAKLGNVLAAPLEKVMALLPANWSEMVRDATHKALRAALEAAVLTLDDRHPKKASNFLHKLLAAATGSVGVFGLASLPFELPLSTVIMLRSIADAARSEGESIKSAETKVACLEVFALGGRSKGDDAAESGYFSVRAALATSVTEAAEAIAAKHLAEDAPAVLRFITAVANRFGLTVSEKVAAQAVPLIGAAGGMLVNTLFIDHFQDMARGHFIVRRLERTYGADEVQTLYRELGAVD